MKLFYSLAPDFDFIDQPILIDSTYTTGLLNKSSGDVLLLNSELTALLSLFRHPATVADAAHTFAEQLNAPSADIQVVIQASVDTFVQQGILITSERLHQKLAYPFPRLQPRAAIKSYVIVKELSVSPPVGTYLVRTQTGEKCVLKKLFIHPDEHPADVRAQKKEFAYEFQILGHLAGCPLIRELIEFDASENIGVTDYFTGVSLRKFIIGCHETLSIARRISLFSQLIEGMDGLHSRQVLHGDLHYSNVLINKKTQLRLIDFDLSFFWKDRTKKGLKYGGIIDFIPPERLTDDVFHQSSGAPNFRAEVYQIGVLGYFIFHGKLPFEGQTWRDQVAAIRCAPPVWESPAPLFIRNLIEKALNKKPAQRFPSATAMKAIVTENRDNQITISLH